MNKVAKTTTPKPPRNLAKRTTKNALTSSRKWLPSALKKNAKEGFKIF